MNKTHAPSSSLVGISVLIFPLLITFAGCAPTVFSFDATQRGYLNKAMRTPIPFTMSKATAQDAWGRAQSFIAKNSSMKLQIATDYVLETYNHTNMNETSYSASRTPIGDSVQFTVACSLTAYTFQYNADEISNRNAHVMAYYMVTGIEPPVGVVTTFSGGKANEQ